MGLKVKQKQRHAEVHQAFSRHRASMRVSRKEARKSGIAFDPAYGETSLSVPVYAEPIDAESRQPNITINRNTGVPQLLLDAVSDGGAGYIEVEVDEDGDHFHADQPIDDDLLMALQEDDITEA